MQNFSGFKILQTFSSIENVFPCREEKLKNLQGDEDESLTDDIRFIEISVCTGE